MKDRRRTKFSNDNAKARAGSESSVRPSHSRPEEPRSIRFADIPGVRHKDFCHFSRTIQYY